MARRKQPRSYALTYSDFAVIGVVSYLHGHRMAMSFNTDLGFRFQQSGSITQPMADGASANFPIFGYEDEQCTTLFRLITNRTPQGILAKEFREFDYFLQIEGDYAESFASSLLHSLRRNQKVLASGLLPARKFRTLIHH